MSEKIKRKKVKRRRPKSIGRHEVVTKGCHYRFREGVRRLLCCCNDGGGHKIQVFPKTKPLMGVPFLVDKRVTETKRRERQRDRQRDREVYNRRDMITADFVRSSLSLSSLDLKFIKKCKMVGWGWGWKYKHKNIRMNRKNKKKKKLNRMLSGNKWLAMLETRLELVGRNIPFR